MIGHIYQLNDKINNTSMARYLVIDKTFVKGNFYYILLNNTTSYLLGSDMQPNTSTYDWIKIS